MTCAPINTRSTNTTNSIYRPLNTNTFCRFMKAKSYDVMLPLLLTFAQRKLPDEVFSIYLDTTLPRRPLLQSRSLEKIIIKAVFVSFLMNMYMDNVTHPANRLTIDQSTIEEHVHNAITVPSSIHFMIEELSWFTISD